MSWVWNEDKENQITYISLTDKEKTLIATTLYMFGIQSNDITKEEITQLMEKLALANPCDKGVLFKGMTIPDKCANCPAETTGGACGLLSMVGIKAGIHEFDDEWFAARKENRRLKYCPLIEIRS